MSVRSRQRAQGSTQVACAADQPFDLAMRVFPDRIRPGQQRATGRRQSKTPTTAVFLIDRNLQEPPPFERLEIGRERRPVHGKKGRDAAERRRFGPVERHQQGKLTVGEIERPQHIVEAARQCARRPVDMQAQAIVAHQVRGGERQLIIFCAGV